MNGKQTHGFANEYIWDGFAADGSNKTMRKDRRVVMFDNFTDYGGEIGKHAKSVGTLEPKRWMIIPEGTALDKSNSFTGNYSLKFTVPPNLEKGRTISQWVDTRALRGEPMNGEFMTGRGNMQDALAGIKESEYGPPGQSPVYDTAHKEGGYDHLFMRAAVMFGETYENSVHTGMGLSGGYFNRPHFYMGSLPEHPGSSAGYRSNGFDRFIASLEPNMRTQTGITPPEAPRQPGWLNIYNYGAEQTGIHGNHIFADGTVVPATGGDRTRFLSRYENKNKGFIYFDNYCPPLCEWITLEYELKLNTVIGTPVSPGSNFLYPRGDHEKTQASVVESPIGSKYGRGPQPVPVGASADYKVLADGIIRVWANGILIMNYEDIIIRHTNEMTIDLVQFSAYFRNPPKAVDVWYDNVVVATEYIGPVNKTGADPDR